MTFLAPVIFWDLRKRPKNDRIKKNNKVKNFFFHARQPHEGIFEICSNISFFQNCFLKHLSGNFRSVKHFFKKKCWLKSLQMVRTLTGIYISLENRKPYITDRLFKSNRIFVWWLWWLVLLDPKTSYFTFTWTISNNGIFYISR